MKNTETKFPFVSSIIVTRNEEDYIELALHSLINQSYPHNKYEIIIVDGMSSDSTRDIVNRTKELYKDSELSIKLLDNPNLILASGWNIGIKQAKGEYVVRIDAHARADKDFLMNSVKTILDKKVACVGGKLLTKTLKDNDELISKVLSSPFGVGNSSFRISHNPGFVDTAVYGLYNKMIFKKVGYFNEKYIRNQDLEMHSRIRKTGERFYFNPIIKSIYFARNSFSKMIKQAYQNGFWNMVLLKEDYSGLSIRHLVPFGFVLFLFFFSIGGFLLRPLWYIEAVVMGIYFILAIWFGIKSGAQTKDLYKMVIYYLSLHISYGTGFIFGMFK